jgi:hypothetical protein
MNTHADRINENKSQSVANTVLPKSMFQFVDNRPEAVQLRKLQKITNNKIQTNQLRAIQLLPSMGNYSALMRVQKANTETVQLAKSDPGQITEGDWAHVPSGGTLTFSSLSAGCLAVVVNFDGGGGAGVHLALNLGKQSQWRPFTDAIAAKKITNAFLYGDIVGTEQGWYVQSGFDEDYMPKPNTEISPASLGDLQVIGEGGAQGWGFDIGSMLEWFKATLGAGSIQHISTQDVVHNCP